MRLEVGIIFPHVFMFLLGSIQWSILPNYFLRKMDIFRFFDIKFGHLIVYVLFLYY